MTGSPLIEVVGLWKRYGLPLPRLLTKSAAFLTRGSERTDTLPWALQDIAFSLNAGENLGIIGRNGAGKSTLLKILAGVSPATKGKIQVRGRVFPMIELQAGVSPDLTGRENIMLLGAVMGFGPREIRRRYEEIADFSELGDWLERPVRMYSSGMQARLSFSVAAHAEADILLVDEVLGVGDHGFQRKCIEHLEKLRIGKQVATVIVSHNPYQIQRLSDRVLLLESGKQKTLTDSARALDLYFQTGSRPVAGLDAPIVVPPPETREGSGALRITRIEQIGAGGDPVSIFQTGAEAVLRLHYKTTRPARNPNFGLRVLDSQNVCLLSFTSSREMSGKVFSGEGYVDCRLTRMPLVGGSYSLQVKVAGDELYDFIQSAPSLRVESNSDVLVDTSGLGIFYQEAEWRLC